MNVLLLALSTVSNGKLNCFSYQYEDEPSFNGYYQLEPIPKFLNEKLEKEKQEHLDYIITLNTKEVNSSVLDTVICNSKNGIEYEFFNITAKMFFEKMLCNGQKAFQQMPKIISIPIDVDDIIPGIILAMNQLRKLKDKSNDFNLYIDMHGGPRNTQMTFQTILSLLKHESIYPSSIYTIIMNKSKPNTIKDDTKYFDYIDFVSGMNEFLNFGKPISIKSLNNLNDLSLRDFTEKANQIADALTLCDMSAFQKSLEDMSNWLNNREIKQDSLLELFIKNIRMDYGVLLKEDHDVIDEIQWWLTKGYLQQALTLIESKMPEELFKKGIFHYDENFMVEIKKDPDKSKIKVKDAIECAKAAQHREWESDINYIFIKWIKVLDIFDKDDNGKHISFELNKTHQEYLDFYLPFWPDFKNKIFLTVSRGKSVALKVMLKNEIYINQDLQDMCMRFLILHYTLKQERNIANHAIGERKTNVYDIKEAIAGYIDLARILYRA